MTHGNDAPDPGAAEDALIDLVASGSVTRVPAGAGALWLPTEAVTGELRSVA